MKFEIYPKNVGVNISRLNDISGELNKIYSDMEEVINTNAIQMDSYIQVKRALRNYQQNVHILSKNTSAMGDGLQKVLNQYEEHEQTICDHVSHGKTMNVDLSSLWDFVGKAGIAGQTISAVGKLITGNKKPIAKWTEFVSDGWNIGWGIKDVVKTCKEDINAVWWKECLGWSSGSLGKIAKSNLSSSQKAFHGFQSVAKSTMREFKSTAGRVKQVGGIILSGAVNAFDNYEEYKNGEISVGRAVAETVTETAVDWGKNLLIAAGVTAAAAAAGFAAPALVVGAATVAVSMGLDCICKWATEKFLGEKKDLTEFLSDAVLDGAKWAGDKIVTGAKQAREGAVTLWNNVSSGWNKLTGNVSAAFAW